MLKDLLGNLIISWVTGLVGCQINIVLITWASVVRGSAFGGGNALEDLRSPVHFQIGLLEFFID